MPMNMPETEKEEDCHYDDHYQDYEGGEHLNKQKITPLSYSLYLCQ